MRKIRYKYDINEHYNYNVKQLQKFHSIIDGICDNYSRVMVVRIDLFKVEHNHILIDRMFDKLNSNRKFKENIIFWSYCLEYKEIAGEHFHFTFIFDIDKKFKTSKLRSKYSISPYNAGFHTVRLMREFFSGMAINAEVNLLTFDDVKHLPKISIGIWDTNDLEKTNDVCYGLCYLYKTSNKLSGYNQKDKVKSKKKVSFSKLYIRCFSR